MNPELVHISYTNQWLAIVPELSVGCLALALLVLEILLPKKEHKAIPATSLAGLLGALAGVFINYRSPYVSNEIATFGGMLAHTPAGQFMRVFFLLTAILVTWLGMEAFKKQNLPRVEFFSIVLVVTAAMMLLAQSNHFVMFFVALETITVGFYVLVSYFRNNALSLEAGLKYLITGALSSGVMLFGIVLLYGVAGDKSLPGSTASAMNFGALQAFLDLNKDNFVASLGIVLVLSGVAFKIGAVPFQIWIPDVYQGAPTPVTAFLAVGSKAAGFAVLMVLTMVFRGYSNIVVPLLAVLAALTIIVGNLGALTQHNVKRLIGLSGVSHAGYLLLGVIAACPKANGETIPYADDAVYFYLVVYLLASFAVFGVMAHLAGTNDADQELEHYINLSKKHPFYAAVLAIGLGSLAGIPPLAGFIGKLLVFVAAFRAELYWLLAVAIIGVIISIYYYFRWIKAAYFPVQSAEKSVDTAVPEGMEGAAISAATGTVLTLLAIASVGLGFFQAPLMAWLGKM